MTIFLLTKVNCTKKLKVMAETKKNKPIFQSYLFNLPNNGYCRQFDRSVKENHLILNSILTSQKNFYSNSVTIV